MIKTLPRPTPEQSRQDKLFDAAYSNANRAADELNAIANSFPVPNPQIDVRKVRYAITHLSGASAALVTLERLLSGNPEPKKGD